MSATVLITDRVSPVCPEILEKAGFSVDVQLDHGAADFDDHVSAADAWIVRSGTKITTEYLDKASRLRVIGRAGVGVDNVNLEAATRKGVLVMNAPDGNTISTAEHTCAMMLALVRRIPQANRSLVGGAWDRKSFVGAELYEKTLGVVGVGKIGQAVAERMAPFGVTVLGYDPLLSEEVAARIGVSLVTLEELLDRSDIITVHTPLNDSTRGLLNSKTLARCKPGVLVVNCARGGIVDEADLLAALESGQVGGAALDVYSSEPPSEPIAELVKHPHVVATPHIAASTGEAQEKVAVQVTEQVVKALQGEPVDTAVNAMAIKMAGVKEVQPYLNLADRLGVIAAQLAGGQLKHVTLRFAGETPRAYSEVLAVSALRGMFSRIATGPVNLINTPVLAREMGLGVDKEVAAKSHGYTNLVEVRLESETGTRSVAGTVFGADDPRVVRVDDYWLEAKPEGWMLFYNNVDRPGMLAAVGAILADAGINIGSMALGRKEKGAHALTIIHLDESIDASIVDQVSALDGVENVRVVGV
jgi:D-3-phosphoglycerate dehydrogenase